MPTFEDRYALIKNAKPVFQHTITDISTWAETVKQSLRRLETYLVANEPQFEIHRQLFNLLVSADMWFVRSAYHQQCSWKLYDLPNFYIVSTKLVRNSWYEEMAKTVEMLATIKEKADLKLLYQSIIKEHRNLDLDLVYMAYKNNEIYCRLSPRENEVFSLEIIVIDYKVLE